jgi:hypothetical protein
MNRSFGALFRVLSKTAGPAAFQRAAPLYSGVGVVAGILFGGNGMDAADMTRLAAQVPALRIFLWVGWLLITLPAAQALFCTPSTFLLRAFPVPRRHFLLVHALHLSLAELPMIVLWGRGEGAVAGVAAGFFAMAGHTLLLARIKGPSDLVAALVWAGAMIGGAPSYVLLPCAGLVLAVGLPRAFARAPERSTPKGRGQVRGSAAIALGRTYALLLLRGDSSLLLRAGLLWLIGLFSATLSARNNGIVKEEALATLALTLLAPVQIVALGGLAAAVQRGERRMS